MNDKNTPKSSSSQFVIDGSKGEGGGQILRNAITYATIFNVPLKVHSIRAGRKKPGLKAQHKTGLILARDICGGTLIGAEIDSTCIEYIPAPPSTFTSITTTTIDKKCDRPRLEGGVKGNDECGGDGDELSIRASIGTAGSICLLLQVGLPCALLSQSSLSSSSKNSSHHTTSTVSMHLEGGTNADLAPQIDYFEEVFLPTILKHCLKETQNTSIIGNSDYADDDADAGDGPVRLNIERRGYYPIGGGVLHCKVSQRFQNSTYDKPLSPIILMERGTLKSVHIRSFYGGNAPRFVAERIANSALELILQNRSILKDDLITDTSDTDVIPTVEIVKHESARGSGTGIIIVAKTNTGCIFGGSALGNRKIKPKITGEKAAKELIDALTSGGCVDDWLSDQLILFMALAKGESKILTGGLTLHTRSAIEVATHMTNAKFSVEKIEEETTSKQESVNESPSNYGSDGRISGKHIISCLGVGLSKASSSSTK